MRNFVDPLKLKMPVFGALFQKIALSRFTRNFGTMLHAGVPDPAEPRHRRRHLRQHGRCRRGPRRPGERPER